jgi:hypothetical protein
MHNKQKENETLKIYSNNLVNFKSLGFGIKMVSVLKDLSWKITQIFSKRKEIHLAFESSS